MPVEARSRRCDVPRPKKSDAAWLEKATAQKRRCRVCTEPGRASRLRDLLGVMREIRKVATYRDIAAKLSEDFGGNPLCLGTVRNHLLDHEPEWQALNSELRK